MKIGVVGCGMVGLAYAKALLIKKFNVIGYDTLKNEFSHNWPSILECNTLILCLPTMPLADGRMDLSSFDETFDKLKTAKFKGLIIIKSTVLPGTTKHYRKESGLNIVHSGEFLSEATALYDVLHPSKIVLGIPDEKVNVDDFYRIHRLFDTEIVETDSTTSEFAKFMQNSFYATKTVFAQEMSEVAKLLGADYNVAKNILYKEQIIGASHLSVNNKKCYGGACLPKDVRQLLKEIENKGYTALLLSRVQEVNEREKKLEED